MVRPVWITPMPSAWIYPWPCWPTSRPIPLRSSLLPPCKNMTRLWWWANKPLGRDIIKNTFRLVDGSAVAISTGKYFTPKGESLAGVGVMPDVPVKLDQESSDALDQGILEREKDLQLQAAVAALEEAA